jgi:CRP/FNR family cyclic AMP-dependent transcriptional regulator
MQNTIQAAVKRAPVTLGAVREVLVAAASREPDRPGPRPRPATEVFRFTSSLALDSRAVRLRKERKVELIGGVPLFARCSRRQLRTIAALADEIERPAGKVLAKQGTPGREFFVIVDGAAEVRRDSKRLALLGPGDFFGEIALVTRAPRTATVALIEHSSLLVLAEREFDALLKDQPEIQTRILRALADRLAEAGLS